MANNNGFDVNKDYYTILGVNSSVTTEELRQIMDTRGTSFSDDEAEAYSVLTNTRLRNAYDKQRSSNTTTATRQKVVSSQNGIQQSNIGKNILKGVGVAALVATIIVGFYHSDKHDLFSGGAGKSQTIFEDQYEASDGNTSIFEDSTQSTENDEETNYDVVETKSYGDATDLKQVNERVELVQKQLLDLGIININTGVPYTNEEITKLIQYINGAYLPANEAEAYSLVNMVLDFTCGVISNECSLNMIQYQAKSDVISKEMVESDIKDHDAFDFRLLLMSDTYCGPALDYFQNAYNGLMSTTDRTEFKAIYDNTMQTYADFIFGDGKNIEGVNFTIESFEGSQQQAASVILWMYGMTIPTYDVEGSKQEYLVDYSQAGEDIPVSAILVKEQFNVLCDAEELSIDDEGLVALPSETNFAQNRQIQLINAGLENLYHGNTDAYQINNAKTLKKN